MPSVLTQRADPNAVRTGAAASTYPAALPPCRPAALPPSLPYPTLPYPTLPYPSYPILPTHLLAIILQVSCLRRLPRNRQGQGRAEMHIGGRVGRENQVRPACGKKGPNGGTASQQARAGRGLLEAHRREGRGEGGIYLGRCQALFRCVVQNARKQIDRVGVGCAVTFIRPSRRSRPTEKGACGTG